MNHVDTFGAWRMYFSEADKANPKPKRKPLLKLPTQYEVDKMRNKDKAFLQKKGKGK